MNNAEAQPESLPPVQVLDELFLCLIKDLCNTIHQTAGSAASQIIDLSSNFLSKETQHLLSEFHELYADNTELAACKHRINEDVDRIIHDTTNLRDDHTAPTNETDSPLCHTRVGLAAAQRDLEKQIIRDENIRRHALPVLESMQFEETLARSLSQTVKMWELVTRHLEQDPAGQTHSLNNDILAVLKSKSERALFYKIVLDKDFDEDHVENSDI